MTITKKRYLQRFNFKKNSSLAIILSVSLSACTMLSTDFDKQLGQENAQLVATQMGLYQPEQMQQYVDSVGQRLVKELDNNSFNFEFHIVDDAVPNAFALPGGYIYVSRGLLALLVTEDELACVLAHEISHVTQRHSVKQMSSGILPAIIEIPGNIVGLFSDRLGNIINTPISAGNALVLSGYSRSHETEADTLGIKLAAKAGYEPTSMSHILVRINAAVELTEQIKQEKSYFASHPYTPDRVENVNNISKQLTITNAQPIDQDFPQMLDGLVYGENPANGVFQDALFLHPTMDFALQFPNQFALYNQPQAVVATREKEQIFFALTGVSNKQNAQQNAQSFQQEIGKNLGDNTPEIETIDFNWGGTGYYISVQDKQQSPVATLQFMWIDLNDITFQISAMSSKKYASKFKENALSFRPISLKEKSSIEEKVLHIVKAKKDENIKQISLRENSVEELAFTTMINDLNQEQSLRQGQAVKVITEKPFVEGLSVK